MTRSRLSWLGVLIAPVLLSGCAFGQLGTSSSPLSGSGSGKSSAATSAEAALAEFSPDERARILAVQEVVEQAADERKVDRSLINAIIWVESRFDVNAQSPAGARGLMQLMPSTAAYLAKRLGDARPRANDPAFNVRAGSLYLAEMINKFGDETRAVAAYHAGPGNVAKWVAAGSEFPEWSNEYVAKVMSARERFRDLPEGGRAHEQAAAQVVTRPRVAAVAALTNDDDDDEPIEAPDPDSLPDATELRRMADAGLLDGSAVAVAVAVEPNPEPALAVTIAIEAPIEPVFEVHPEIDANPHAGPPPGWPTRAQPSEPESKPKPKSKPILATKQPSAPTADEPLGLGVLPDL